MLTPEAKQFLIDTYRSQFLQHKEGPHVGRWSSLESQQFRFQQLAKIGNLTGRKVLEVGCGIADFLPFLRKEFADLDYTGIDIVAEAIDYAKHQYPEAKFLCRDILEEPLDEDYDHVLMSGIFNNAIPGAFDFLRSLTKATFARTRISLGFNFISTYHNYEEEGLTYLAPPVVLDHCLSQLSVKTTMFHHYERADVCVFVYK
jgi:SAM-dependent methyltransferase